MFPFHPTHEPPFPKPSPSLTTNHHPSFSLAPNQKPSNLHTFLFLSLALALSLRTLLLLCNLLKLTPKHPNVTNKLHHGVHLNPRNTTIPLVHVLTEFWMSNSEGSTSRVRYNYFQAILGLGKPRETLRTSILFL